MYIYRVHVDVKGCPENKCSCQVHTNRSEDKPISLEFTAENGSATIKNLEPNTLYLFIITCKGIKGPASIERTVETDNGRPSPPSNVTISLVGNHLQATWSPPSDPAGKIANYNITIDNKDPISIPPSIKNSKIFDEEYVYGTKHKDGKSICSDPVEEQVLYELPTTTTPRPNGVESYSISISLIIFSLFLSVK
jgi:hypothetical protein